MPIESMKITNVKATWLRVPIPEARQSVSDFGRNDSFNTTLVRVETDEGLVGYGEAKASVGSIGAQRALVAVIEGELAPLLVGEEIDLMADAHGTFGVAEAYQLGLALHASSSITVKPISPAIS